MTIKTISAILVQSKLIFLSETTAWKSMRRYRKQSFLADTKLDNQNFRF